MTGMTSVLPAMTALSGASWTRAVLSSTVCSRSCLRRVHVSSACARLRHNWDAKLRIATGTIKRRNTALLPQSAAVNVAEPQPDPSRGLPQEDGGVRYHGFVYYPRRDGQGRAAPDPPLTAARLHRVQVIAPLKGQPYWVRNTLKRLDLEEGRLFNYTVLINSAENNALLYVVKHVVRIDPVTFPEGVPTASDDLSSWRLLEDGRVVRYAPPVPVASEYRERYAVDGTTLKKRLLLRWYRPFWLDDKITC